VTRSQQELLRQYGIRPVKRRGQNFLLDGNLARAIAADALALGDEVLELGAGGGALTVHLLEGARTLACVEVDRGLYALLQGEFGERPGFRAILGDLTRLDWDEALAAAGTRPVIAGNLPYVLTSLVLFKAAELRGRIAGAVFMIQKEVAERLVAEPGGRDYGVLAVVLGSVFSIRQSRTVPASVFWPRPQVNSAVVSLTPAGDMPDPEFAWFREVVKRMFGQRRKQVSSQLRTQFGLTPPEADAVAAAAGLDPGWRPEQVAPDGYRRLARLLEPKEVCR
jgi:16S rRNA (adenine1518-N6/adenine1519-N6)-dimethyltransferase